jgi:hypothetical protein
MLYCPRSRYEYLLTLDHRIGARSSDIVNASRIVASDRRAKQRTINPGHPNVWL